MSRVEPHEQLGRTGVLEQVLVQLPRAYAYPRHTHTDTAITITAHGERAGNVPHRQTAWYP